MSDEEVIIKKPNVLGDERHITPLLVCYLLIVFQVAVLIFMAQVLNTMIKYSLF